MGITARAAFLRFTCQWDSLPAFIKVFAKRMAVLEEVRFMGMTVKQRFKPSFLLTTNFLGNPKSFILFSELEELLLAHERPSQSQSVPQPHEHRCVTGLPKHQHNFKLSKTLAFIFLFD